MKKERSTFERSYERPNLILASHAYCRRFGNMTQEDKLYNISSADSGAARDLHGSISWNKLASLAQDYRLWFVICEWLKHGVFSDNTCVVFQRKFQDYEQVLAEAKVIADKYKSKLFVYPTSEPSLIFIFYPDDRKESTLSELKKAVNYELHNWSHKPAFFSDIRTWPLRYDPFDDCRKDSCCPPIGFKCLHEEW